MCQLYYSTIVISKYFLSAILIRKFDPVNKISFSIILNHHPILDLLFFQIQKISTSNYLFKCINHKVYTLKFNSKFVLLD